MIGMFGEVIFNVSFDGKNKKILNFTNLKLSGGANFKKHSRKGHKPALKFIDPIHHKIKLFQFKIFGRADSIRDLFWEYKG